MNIRHKPLMTLFSTLLLVTTVQFAFAQKILESNATLLDATIYNRGATLHHSSKQVAIPAGNSEIVISQIAQNVDPQSIRITSSSAQLTILSVSFEHDYLVKGENKSAQYLEVKKKYDQSFSVLNELINQRKGEESTLALLEENRKFGGHSGVTPTSITTMIKYYREQYKVIADNILVIKAKEEEKQKDVEKLKMQLEEAGGSGQNAGQMVVRVSSSQAVNTDFNINYFTYDVSWAPFYEVRVDQLNLPLNLIYKANVSQNTGIDWKQIKLIFASGNPRQNNNMPSLQPWRIGFQPPVVAYGAMKIMGRASIESKAMLKNEVASQDMAQVEDNQLSTSFVIETPYDVFSNGKSQSVQLQSYKLPAVYSYFTAPKADEAAFLIGKITDWEKLNLLPGNANLIIDNNYAGTSYIDPGSTLDTLIFSLGRDERIITKRERINEEGSTSFLGNSERRIYTYEISIRNSRKEAIDLEVKEQYPLSNEKEIEVKLGDVSNAQINAEKGELIWNLHLSPGETKKLKVTYSIKSPKGKNVNGI